MIVVKDGKMIVPKAQLNATAPCDPYYKETEMLTEAKLNELEELAKMATPGEWEYCGDNRGGCICGAIYSRKYNFVIATAMVGESNGWMQKVDESAGKANQMFIAAANPKTILALLAEIRRLKTELENKK